MELTVLDHQPDFPEVDLTQGNAAFFEFFLQNSALVEASHPDAEKNNILFKLAHRAAINARNTFNEDAYYASFTHGFTLYEITSSLVAPRPIELQDASVIASILSLDDALQRDKQDELFISAREELIAQQPKTAEVIERAANRFFPHLTHYAVMGAAMERQLELGAREFNKNIVQ